jgi:hypothetical protein
MNCRALGASAGPRYLSLCGFLHACPMTSAARIALATMSVVTWNGLLWSDRALVYEGMEKSLGYLECRPDHVLAEAVWRFHRVERTRNTDPIE